MPKKSKVDKKLQPEKFFICDRDIVIIPDRSYYGKEDLGFSGEALEEIARYKGVLGPFSVGKPLYEEKARSIARMHPGLHGKPGITEIELDVTQQNNILFLLSGRVGDIRSFMTAHIKDTREVIKFYTREPSYGSKENVSYWIIL